MIRMIHISQSLLQEKRLLNWNLRIVFSIKQQDTYRFGDITNKVEYNWTSDILSCISVLSNVILKAVII